ncbi:MAG: methionyl-tRNA formyltransferase [Bacteroidetes bacterium HGW-Bacteroidetes-9]|nr:MAG: methionyl-tRNA formyltransferase [Bacteroidetes bacterium HGW-Bacteroidetes-9]
MDKVRIVFMGTPEFAVESLRQLLESNYDIAAVVTVPDKPAGRGLKLKESAIKQFAVSQNLPVLQPHSLKDEDFLKKLDSCNANLFIVVAFRILPEKVWVMPKFGTFNLHGSLLPDYRGAAPINHAIINGETESGVTTFFLNSGIDTGKIIMNRRLPIGPDDTAGDLHDKLMHIGASLVVETVKLIESGSCRVVDQPASTDGLKPAPRIFREHCRINWSKSAKEVHNLIRGLSPYPGAYSILSTDKGATEVKILRSVLTDKPSGKTPGETLIMDEKKLLVSCADRFIELTEVKPAGKKAMTTDEFLRGIRSIILHFES